MAEGEGFEPPLACTKTVFKTVAFGHSANPPLVPLLLRDNIQNFARNEDARLGLDCQGYGI